MMNRGLICESQPDPPRQYYGATGSRILDFGPTFPRAKMSKMQAMRILLGCGFLATILLLAGAPTRADDTLALTIVQINDLARADDVADRGGLAKLATIIRNERATGRPVIVAHAGNAISPSLLSNFDQGAH